MDAQRLYRLLEKYTTRTASAGEEQELFSLLEEGDEESVKSQLLALQMTRTGTGTVDPSHWKPVLDRILSTASIQAAVPAQAVEPLRSVGQPSGSEPRRFIIPWPRIAAASVILLILAPVGYLFIRSKLDQANHAALPVAQTPAPAAIVPGGNHAILTMSGGRTILLDSARDGQLDDQGVVRVVKLEAGRLAYRPYSTTLSGGSVSSARETVYNSVATPRGGYYQVGLPDGTQVWLNAASSLRFPEVFNGPAREVDVTGEAYFEVAPDKAKPFIVHTRHTEVTVLGTAFNINAYDDEKTLQTTLLEGAVKYAAGGSEKLLRPGQQAIFDTTARTLSLRTADLMRVIAWKNGRFELENTSLPEILRQISRWYNVDIKYKGDIGDARFGGGLSRQLSLTEVLQFLASTGLHFTLDQRVITVSP